MIIISETVVNPVIKRRFEIAAKVFFVIVIALIFSLGIYIGSTLPPHVYWSQAGEIRELYKTEYNGLNPDKIVDGFDPYKDTFHFPNFGSTSSKFGNCHAIAYVEKSLFDKKYDNLQDIDPNKKPGEYTLTTEELTNTYKTDNPDEVFTRLLFPFHYPREWFWFEYYNVVNVGKDEPEEYLEDTGALEQANTGTFDTITTLQNDLNSKRDDYYSDVIVVRNREDVKKTIEQIDNNNLLIMTVVNSKSGHAVLAYGYKKVNDDEYIIYVADNNIPMLDTSRTYMYKDKPVAQDKITDTNNQIKNNVYILIKLKDDKAYFKYNPVVNKCYLYSGSGFNSYIPNAELRFYW